MNEDNVNRRRLVGGVAALVGAGLSGLTVAEAAQQNANAPATTAAKQRNAPQQPVSPAVVKDSQRPQRPSSKTGEDPLVRDEPRWQKALATLAELAAIYDPAKQFPRVEHGYAYTAKPGDDEFRLQHIEALLDQAADLLDRALKTRNDWNNLNDKRFTLFLNLKEYSELDRIHIEETKKGFYTVAYKQSSSLEEAESWVSAFSASTATYLTSLLADKFNFDEKNRQSAQAQLQAWLAHLAVYQFPFVGDALPCTFDNVTKTAPEHMKDSEFIQSFYRMEVEEGLTRSSESNQRGNAQASASRLKGLTEKVTWDYSDIDFRRRRTQVARDMADLKAIAFTTAGGALNYSEQMKNLQIRFQRDLNDAVARMPAIVAGMSQLYGYDVPPPSDTSSSTYFDELLAWARDAISRLIRFGLVDQNYVKPIPLSSLVPASQLQDGLRKGQWDCEIGETLFPSQTNIRLRGVSATVVLKDDDDHQDRRGLWTVLLTAPRMATIRLQNGKTAAIDQKSIPTVQLGRVSHYDSPRDPDVVGISALHNVSPIGKWSVALDETSTSGRNLDRLKDLIINLHLAVRFVTQRP